MIKRKFMALSMILTLLLTISQTSFDATNNPTSTSANWTTMLYSEKNGQVQYFEFDAQGKMVSVSSSSTVSTTQMKQLELKLILILINA